MAYDSRIARALNHTSRSKLKVFGVETGSWQIREISSLLVSRVLSRFGLIFTDIASEYLARERPATASFEELAELDKLAGQQYTAMILMCWRCGVLKTDHDQPNGPNGPNL